MYLGTLNPLAGDFSVFGKELFKKFESLDYITCAPFERVGFLFNH